MRIELIAGEILKAVIAFCVFLKPSILELVLRIFTVPKMLYNIGVGKLAASHRNKFAIFTCDGFETPSVVSYVLQFLEIKIAFQVGDANSMVFHMSFHGLV